MVDGKRKHIRKKLAMGASVTAAVLIFTAAHAMPEKDYKMALKLAQEKVNRTHSAVSAEALSSPIIKAYFGRYYQVGDSWDVASWEIRNPLMSLTPIPADHALKVGRGGIFHYEVKDVRNGATPQVVISVKQVFDYGMKPVDPQVEEITLTMSDQLVQTEKAYKMRDASGPIKVSPDGLRTRLSPLELFALDVPEIATAVHNEPSALPSLPAEVQTLATRAGYKPNLSQSTSFEQDDFFGRPVQILWQYGNPWPSYLKTDTGISILIGSSVNGNTDAGRTSNGSSGTPAPHYRRSS